MTGPGAPGPDPSSPVPSGGVPSGGVPSPHWGLDDLADHVAGERPADAHLRTCAGCSSRLAEVERAQGGVRAALAALADPPLPAGLAARLDAALGELAASGAGRDPGAGAAAGAGGDRAAGGGPAAGASASRSATVTPLASRRRRTWLPAAAAAAVLVSGGALGYGAFLSDRSGGDSLAAGAQDVRAGLPTSASGVDYADPSAAAAALPAVLSGTASGGALAPDLDAAARAEQGAPDADPESDSADEAAPGVGAGAGEPPSAPGPAALLDSEDAAVQDPLGRLRDPAELDSCLRALLPPEDPDQRPLALDYARYDGEPALVVVLPADGTPDAVDLFVVGPGCREGDDQVRHFLRLDRP